MYIFRIGVEQPYKGYVMVHRKFLRNGDHWTIKKNGKRVDSTLTRDGARRVISKLIGKPIQDELFL